MSLPSFEQYFSDEAIRNALSKLRARKAKVRHDQQFLRNISTRAQAPSDMGELDRLFPSRQYWTRPRHEQRRGLNSMQLNEKTLLRTVQKLRSDSAHQFSPWRLNLTKFIIDLRRQAVEDANYRIAMPKILPQEKKLPYYRPIAVYSLDDRIVIGQCTRYLRDIFDADFLPCSYAFRAPQQAGKSLSHHDAATHLMERRTAYNSLPLWVAECDIASFFDCVHHEQTRQALRHAESKALARGIAVDSRAKSIFESYLQSYDFPKIAQENATVWFKNQKLNGKLAWPIDGLRQYWTEPAHENIGIPQGGALSCLVANLMLHYADEAVMQGADPELFYARYCDDMIIVHPCRDACEHYFSRYLEALQHLKLPYHSPQQIDCYNRKFWKFKSKKPYAWAQEIVPWVGFVGYQVRYDSLVRIRSDSMKKALEKQVQEADNVLKVVRPKPKGSPTTQQSYTSQVRKRRQQILFRLQQRLISMSVGRRDISLPPRTSTGFCWVEGFKAMQGRNALRAQLRRLDKGRERQLRRVKRALQGLPSQNVQVRKQPRMRKYYGSPFSHAAQFPRTTGK